MLRTFTLEEANELVPNVASSLARTTLLLGRVRAVALRLAELGVLGEPHGQLPEPAKVAGRPALERELVRARMLLATAEEEAQRLERAGVVIRDLERGWVGFRSVLDGEREVLLSWHLGEREIRHFHDLHGSLLDREPIDGHRFFRRRQLRPPQ